MENRPAFEDIKTFEEFIQYYWYRDELQQICRAHGIDHSGGKIELNHRIAEFYKGNIIAPVRRTTVKKQNVPLTPETRLLESGFAMRSEYRDFFGEQLGVKKFRFTADMAAAVKKVRQTKDKNFTVRDLMDVYLGKSDYATYDKSSCQWNQFVKDFYADPINADIDQKQKKVTALWKLVRQSKDEKVYSRELLIKYQKELENMV